MNLPSNMADFADFGPTPDIETMPFLSLDTGKGDDSLPGKWRFEGLAFKSIQAAFIHATEYNRVFTVPYDVDKNAPVACSSWNGRDAYGMGDQTPIVEEQLRERQCEGCPARESFTCRPCLAILLAFRGVPAAGGSMGDWHLGVYRASGLQVKAARGIWGKVSIHSESFRMKQGDKEIKLPKWCFGVDARGQERPSQRSNHSGWAPVFDSPAVLDGDSIQALAPLMAKGGQAIDMWQRFMEQSEKDARAITASTDTPPPAAGQAGNHDDDVPF